MILSDKSIWNLVEAGRIGIEPFDPRDVQPASVDLHLANDFKLFNPPPTPKVISSPHGDDQWFAIDPQEPVDESLYRKFKLTEGDSLALWPRQFMLASTEEEITLPDDIGARIEGKSSLARLGIAIHSTGGFIDPGFKGQITLEISSVMPHPVLLRPGMKIAQIGFYLLDQPAVRPYGSSGLGSKYQGQRGATVSRYNENEPVE